MSLSKWFVLTVCLLPLVGCGGSDSKATPAAGTTAEIEPLALPDEVSDELRKSYTHASRGMSPDAIHKFAMITEDVGLALTPNEIRYEFFKQSARLLREALADGADIDDEDIALITYNEACAFSKENKTEEAMRALGEAMKHGYRNIQHINSDEDLVNIRKLDNFSSELAKWQVVAEGHHAAEIAKLLESGETFPFEFTLTDIGGVEHTLDEAKGKVVIVDFWGTWCPPCVAEIPAFIKLQEKYGGDKFQMYGISFEQGNSEAANVKLVTEFARRARINYPCLMGDSIVKSQIEDFMGYPTTLFIDKTGKVRLKVAGQHDYEYLESIVQALMME